MINLTIHEATSVFKVSPVLTDLLIEACKIFIPLAAGFPFKNKCITLSPGVRSLHFAAAYF